MVGELINFLTSTSETLCQVPNHLSASIHVEGREAHGAGGHNIYSCLLLASVVSFIPLFLRSVCFGWLTINSW